MKMMQTVLELKSHFFALSRDRLLFIMRPHTNDFNGSNVIHYLIDQSALNPVTPADAAS